MPKDKYKLEDTPHELLGDLMIDIRQVLTTIQGGDCNEMPTLEDMEICGQLHAILENYHNPIPI